MTADILAALTAGVLVALIAFNYGLHRGRALGWLEYYDEEEARKKAMRDSHGRFAGKKGAV